MADRITKEQRSRIMSHIKSVNTSLEINFKKLLYKNKIKGFKKHLKMLGNPDFSSSKKRIAIFIDGDFWHGYNWKKLGKIPPKKYWQKKIEKTIERDKKYTKQLKKEGWKVLKLWEHDIKKNLAKCLLKIKKLNKPQ